MKVTGYTRDASWFNHPDTHAPKRVHRQAEPPLAGMAACNTTRIMLVTEHPVTVESTSTALCRRCFPVLREQP